MTKEYNHDDLLKACREGDTDLLKDCLDEGLPVKGFPLKDSPLWALAYNFCQKVDEDHLAYTDNKFDCFTTLVGHADFSEHDYAALKKMHKQTDIYVSGMIHYLSTEDALNTFKFTKPQEQLVFSAKAEYAEHFCNLIDRHVSGEIKIEDDVLREAFSQLGLNCTSGTEIDAIQLAKKMIDNGLGLRKPNEKYMLFFNIIYGNYKELLSLVVGAGELDGVYNEKAGRNLIETLYCYEVIQDHHHENGAIYQLLSTLSEAELHDFCAREKVLEHDDAALAKRALIEKGESVKLHGSRTRLSL